MDAREGTDKVNLNFVRMDQTRTRQFGVRKFASIDDPEEFQ